MKLQSIVEANYASAPTPSGWPAEKVMKAFFDVDPENLPINQDDVDDPLYQAIGYVPKKGLVVLESHHGKVVGYLYKLRNGKYIYQNNDQETEWEVDPTKFKVQETRYAYKGS